MLGNNIKLKKIYILLGIGGVLFLVSNRLSIFVDPFSWSGWWAANVLHTLGGAYVFFFSRAVWIYAKSFYKIEAPRGAEILFWIGGALILGVFWEWYELIIDRYEVWVLRKNSLMTYADNMGDLVFDLGGALLAGIYFWKSKKN